MRSLSSFKPRSVEKILLKNNFYIKRQTGSHRIYYNMKTNAIVVVPFHSKDIPKGTLGSIIRQSKLKLEEFSKK